MKKFKIEGVERIRAGTYKVYVDAGKDGELRIIVYPGGNMSVLSNGPVAWLQDDISSVHQKQVLLAVKRASNETENPIAAQKKILSDTQFYALRNFHDHIAGTNIGPKAYAAKKRNGPFSGKDLSTWSALEKRGFVVSAGRQEVTSGVHHRWVMPTFEITEKGRAAYAHDLALRELHPNPITSKNVIVSAAIIGGLVAFVQIVKGPWFT